MKYTRQKHIYKGILYTHRFALIKNIKKAQQSAAEWKKNNELLRYLLKDFLKS